MKTTTLIACLVAGLLTIAQPTWAAGKPFESRQHPRQSQRPAILVRPAVSGVIPSAIRRGNPLQMFNPFAPARYGTAGEHISVDPDVAGKVNGITFVSISF